MQSVGLGSYNSYPRDESLITHFKNNEKLNFYLQLDKIINDNFVNKTVTFDEVVAYIKLMHPTVYTEIIQRSKDICSVLD
jgi:hypothetical protein